MQMTRSNRIAIIFISVITITVVVVDSSSCSSSSGEVVCKACDVVPSTYIGRMSLTALYKKDNRSVPE